MMRANNELQLKPELIYVHLPVFLLRGMFHKQGHLIDKIFKYAIYSYGIKFNCDILDCCKQAMYQYYRRRPMSKLLKDELLNLNNYIGKDEQYNGYYADGIVAESEVRELLGLVENNDKLSKLLVINHQMTSVLKLLRYNNEDMDEIISIGSEVTRNTPKNEPMVSVRLEILKDFRNKYEDDWHIAKPKNFTKKKEFEFAQLLAYLAIKSIQGKKKYVKTNSNHILARMFGYSSISKIDSNLKEDRFFQKYSNRYHLNKVFDILETSWNVARYAFHTRGIYFSAGGKLTVSDLALIAETTKAKNRATHLQKQRKKAREAAISIINNS